MAKARRSSRRAFSVFRYQPACKPGSVWRVAPRGSHSSGTSVAGRLKQPTRMIWSEDGLAFAASSLFGFAPGGVCRAASVARNAVRSYRTFSPLPDPKIRRFVLCGTFPGVAPAGRYPAPYLRGARTFLDDRSPRLPGRLTLCRWADGCARSRKMARTFPSAPKHRERNTLMLTSKPYAR